MSSLYQRYLSGEREAVWDQLFALKELVNDERYAAEAQAVAAETMKRARHNVEQIVRKLDELGYRYLRPRHASEAPGTVLTTSCCGSIEIQQLVFAPPEPNVADAIEQVEETVGMLPLSLAAWYEQVGSVDFGGHHPVLGGTGDAVRLEGDWQLVESDPLTVFPLLYSLYEFDQQEGSEEEFLFPIAEVRDGGMEGIHVPNESADGIYTMTGHRFVDYLRLSFRHGGFAGWRENPRRPKSELSYLADGLLPI